MIVYIAGPMTGIEDFNRKAFYNVAKKMEGDDCVVLNPAILPEGLTHKQYMEICLAMVRVSDMVYFLPGWEGSKGAMEEYKEAVRRRKMVML